MDSGFYSAFAGLAARMQSLDLVANNLANVNTVGYKGEKEFYKAYAASLGGTALSPLNDAINDFGVLGGARVDMSAGSLNHTGNDTDLAIAGSGFFAVQTAAGVRYTRNGAFNLNTQRQLVDSQGNLVLGQAGPIQIPSGSVLSISPDGTVSMDGAVVNTLKIVDFPAGTQITPEGNTDFVAANGSEQPAADAKVQQGMLEASNSNPISNAVALIDVQRNAEFMERALQIFNTDLNQTAVQDLPKI